MGVRLKDMDGSLSGKNRKSWLYVFAAGCLWGTQGAIFKAMAGYGSTPAYTSFLRMFLGALLLIVITLAFDGPAAFKINRKTLLSCVLLGLISQALYNVAYNTAVDRIGVAMAAILLYTAPVFTAVISFFLFGEKFSGRKGMALLINIAGCVLVVTGGRFAGISPEVSGILFGLLSGLCYAMTPVLGRIASGDSSPFAVAAYNFMFASLFLAVFTRPWNHVEKPFDLSVIGLGFLLALFPTALSYILYFTALRSIAETGKVPVVASVETVVATLLGVLVFRESLGIVNFLGIAAVLFSIAVTCGEEKQAKAF